MVSVCEMTGGIDTPKLRVNEDGKPESHSDRLVGAMLHGSGRLAAVVQTRVQTITETA